MLYRSEMPQNSVRQGESEKSGDMERTPTGSGVAFCVRSIRTPKTPFYVSKNLGKLRLYRSIKDGYVH
jgi:hypothetical protein